MIGLIAAGLAAQAYGQYQSSQAESDALSTESQQATINARSAMLKAKAEAEQQAIQARKFMGEQAGQFAGGNIEGASTYAVQADSMVNAEMDRLSIIFGGNLRSNAFKSEAMLKTSEAQSTKQAGIMGLIATGFKAASKIAGSSYGGSGGDSSGLGTSMGSTMSAE